MKKLTLKDYYNICDKVYDKSTNRYGIVIAVTSNKLTVKYLSSTAVFTNVNLQEFIDNYKVICNMYVLLNPTRLA